MMTSLELILFFLCVGDREGMLLTSPEMGKMRRDIVMHHFVF